MKYLAVSLSLFAAIFSGQQVAAFPVTWNIVGWPSTTVEPSVDLSRMIMTM